MSKDDTYIISFKARIYRKATSPEVAETEFWEFIDKCPGIFNPTIELVVKESNYERLNK